MNTVTITFPTKTWRGIRSKYPFDMAEIGPDDFLKGSYNFDTQVKSTITKVPGAVQYNPIALPSPAKDQYEAIFTDGTHHLLEVTGGTLYYSTGGGTFTSVTTGYSSLGNFEFSIYNDRVYFDNGIDVPQVYDKTVSYGGVTYGVPRTKAMGAQTPVSASTATLILDSTINQVPAGAHTYVVTFLYYGSEESNQGPTSNLVTNDATHTKNTLTLPIGGYGVTARKIYRDNNDQNWLLVGTVNDNTTTLFTDTESVGTAAVPTLNGLPPTFTQIVTQLDRNFVAGVPGSPSTVFFSQPGAPDLFNPITGFVLCNPKDPIVALAVYNNRIIVLNRNSLGQILGNQTSNFQYATIPSSIGCVDNRSVQIRTIRGVPVLVWLSDKGFYQYNGQSVDYISEDIEDQVNFNIQQASQVKGRDAQDTQSDFLGGTSSPGIDLTSNPGFIQTKVPERIWQSEADWEGGSSLANISTHDGTNTLKVPTQFAAVLANGTFNNVTEVSNSLELATQTDASEDKTSFGNDDFPAGGVVWYAQAFDPARLGNGTLSSLTLLVKQGAGTQSFTISVYSDSFGQPGTALYTSGFNAASSPSYVPYTVSPNLPVVQGNRYWIVVKGFSGSGTYMSISYDFGALILAGLGHQRLEFSSNSGASWGSSTADSTWAIAYSMSYPASAGQWVSTVYDSESDSISSGLSVNLSSSYPSGTTGTLLVEGSNDGSTFDVSQSFSNPNGTASVSVSGRRYWRLTLTLTTADSRFTPVLGAPTLFFNTTGTWISEAIDHTIDVTSLDMLNVTSTVPAGTTITVSIATSADNSSYTSFVPFGSQTTQRYSKIKVILTTDGSDTTTPYVTSIDFRWSLSSNLQSSPIDTGNIPVGWELFQSSFVTNGGTVTFYVRTATTALGLSSASYVPASNGAYITATVNQWIQWKVVLTSSALSVPSVDSVTINWFIKETGSIRVASIFFNRNYYLAAAEYGQPANNIVFVYDADNTWKIYRGFSIGTLGFFFNDPYYTDSLTGYTAKFQTGLTNYDGSAITMDVRLALKTPARVANDMDDKIKILKGVTAEVTGTGAVFTFYYSIDGGNTWTAMVDPINGGTTFTTPNDNNRYTVRMVPLYSDSIPSPAGRQMLIRVVEATTAAAEIRSLKARLFLRDQQIVNYNNG